MSQPLVGGNRRAAPGNLGAEEMLETLRLIEERASKTVRLDDFLALLLHEFRNPLNAAVNYLHLLLLGEYGPLTGKQAKIVKRIDAEVESLSALVKVSFDMIHPGTGRKSFKFREADLSVLLEDLEAEGRLLCSEGGVAFECRADPGITSLWTDALRLKMVLRNLLVNAFQYTEKGKVLLEVCHQGEGIAFSVSDTGPGIPEEAMATLFDPFSRIERSGPRQPGGSGLGLYVVKCLLDLLGGRIEVESKPGVGSTFRVWHPLRARS